MREPSRLDVALFSYEEDEGSSSLVTVPILNLVPFTPDLTFSHELGVKRNIVTVFHAQPGTSWRVTDAPSAIGTRDQHEPTILPGRGGACGIAILNLHPTDVPRRDLKLDHPSLTAERKGEDDDHGEGQCCS